MSYPIGFDTDFRGFYFRSVFFPIVLLVAAAYVIGYRREMSAADHWCLVVIALFLSTQPTFYQFEYSVLPSSVCWGLVDNFVAGVSACALAAAFRSVRVGSRAWPAAASLLACLAFFVKPAGLLVMALVGLCWLVGVASLQRQNGFSNHATGQYGWAAWKEIVLSSGLICGIFGTFFLFAVETGYFNRENFTYGKRVTRVMGEVLSFPADQLQRMLSTSFGTLHILVVMLISISAAIYSRRMPRERSQLLNPPLGALLTSACLCLAAGIWFWLVELAGGSVIRYLFPFAFMALTALVLVAQFAVAQMPRFGRAALALIVGVLATNIAALLIHPSPSMDWQRRSGVNLLSSSYGREIDQAKRLVADIGTRVSPSTLYLFVNSHVVGVVGNYADYVRLINPTFPMRGFWTPHDWVNGFGVRISQLLVSDYVLFEPIVDSAQRAALLSVDRVSDFKQEERVFRGWLSSLAEEEGVHKLSEGRVRILRIEDRGKMEASMEAMIKRHQWRPFFAEMHGAGWWSTAEFVAHGEAHPPLAIRTRLGICFCCTA